MAHTFYFMLNGRIINPFADIEMTELVNYREEDRIIEVRSRMKGG